MRYGQLTFHTIIQSHNYDEREREGVDRVSAKI